MTTNGNGNQGTGTGAQYVDYIELGGMVTDVEAQAWDGVQSSVDPGEYTFEVIELKKEQSSKGNPQLNIGFTVVSDGAMNGRRMRGWYSLTEKAIGRLLNLLRACGVPLDDRNGFSTQALVGARFVAEVHEDVYEAGKNPMTQQPMMKTSFKIRGEKPIPTPSQPPKGSTKGAQTARR